LKNIDSSALGEPISSMPYLKELLTSVLASAEKEYSNYLLDNNEVDLNEYMIYLNKCISHESFNSRLYKYKYIFIDEFQDVDDSQINTFLKMNEKIDFKFFIVGDLKQSIYRFRGATMDAFTKMGCEASNWNHYSLNTNYRSDYRLLDSYENIFEKMGDADLIPYTSIDYLKGIKKNKFIDKDFVKKVNYIVKDGDFDDFYDSLFKEVIDRKN
jgi:ATP-dependent exoDNAse (exonuclease V) beta subunit